MSGVSRTSGIINRFLRPRGLHIVGTIKKLARKNAKEGSVSFPIQVGVPVPAELFTQTSTERQSKRDEARKTGDDALTEGLSARRGLIRNSRNDGGVVEIGTKRVSTSNKKNSSQSDREPRTVQANDRVGSGLGVAGLQRPGKQSVWASKASPHGKDGVRLSRIYVAFMRDSDLSKK